MTSNMASSDDTLALRTRLETQLPAEIYNIIYDLTFTADPAIHLYGCATHCPSIDGPATAAKLASDYKHVLLNKRLPHLMHVDPISRRQFAASIFGGTYCAVLGPCGCQRLRMLMSEEQI